MPLDSPPAIVITHTETHNVREEAIERVARQLCEADGCDPNADIRCGPPMAKLDGDSLVVPNVVFCNLLGMSYPSNLAWNAYRDKAEALLKEAFKP
jgi:hypothetical protein